MKTKLLLLLLPTALCQRGVVISFPSSSPPVPPARLSGSKAYATAEFGPPMDLRGNLTAPLVFAQPDDLCGTVASAAAGQLETMLVGAIAVASVRTASPCDYVAKAILAKRAGAVALVMIQATAGAPTTMRPASQLRESERLELTIPVVMVSAAVGEAINFFRSQGSEATLSNLYELVDLAIGSSLTYLSEPGRAAYFDIPVGPTDREIRVRVQTNDFLSFTLRLYADAAAAPLPPSATSFAASGTAAQVLVLSASAHPELFVAAGAIRIAVYDARPLSPLQEVNLTVTSSAEIALAAGANVSGTIAPAATVERFAMALSTSTESVTMRLSLSVRDTSYVALYASLDTVELDEASAQWSTRALAPSPLDVTVLTAGVALFGPRPRLGSTLHIVVEADAGARFALASTVAREVLEPYGACAPCDAREPAAFKTCDFVYQPFAHQGANYSAFEASDPSGCGGAADPSRLVRVLSAAEWARAALVLALRSGALWQLGVRLESLGAVIRSYLARCAAIVLLFTGIVAEVFGRPDTPAGVALLLLDAACVAIALVVLAALAALDWRCPHAYVRASSRRPPSEPTAPSSNRDEPPAPGVVDAPRAGGEEGARPPAAPPGEASGGASGGARAQPARPARPSDWQAFGLREGRILSPAELRTAYESASRAELAARGPLSSRLSGLTESYHALSAHMADGDDERARRPAQNHDEATRRPSPAPVRRSPRDSALRDAPAAPSEVDSARYAAPWRAR